MGLTFSFNVDVYVFAPTVFSQCVSQLCVPLCVRELQIQKVREAVIVNLFMYEYVDGVFVFDLFCDV